MGNRFAAKGPAARMPAAMRKPATTTIPTAAAIRGRGIFARLENWFAAGASVVRTAAVTKRPATIQTTSTAAITGQGFSVRTGLTAATAAAAIRKTADAATESPAIIQTKEPAAPLEME